MQGADRDSRVGDTVPAALNEGTCSGSPRLSPQWNGEITQPKGPPSAQASSTGPGAAGDRIAEVDPGPHQTSKRPPCPRHPAGQSALAHGPPRLSEVQLQPGCQGRQSRATMTSGLPGEPPGGYGDEAVREQVELLNSQAGASGGAPLMVYQPQFQTVSS